MNAPCGWHGRWRSPWWRDCSRIAGRRRVTNAEHRMSGAGETRQGDVRVADPGAWRTAVIVTVAAALVRLFFAWWIPLFPDETYYWDWSRHLAGGYFDHPPMIAVLIRAGTIIGGATPFAVRFFPVVAGAAASFAAVGIARRIG